MHREKPREIALRALQRQARENLFIEDALEKELTGISLPPADRGLCQELAYGMVRWENTLDWLIDRKCKEKLPEYDLRPYLRLGLYQMFWLDRVPDHAAVNEAVELCKYSRQGYGANFVNAVLRGYTREREETLALLAELKVNQPWLGYSQPEWLWERWKTNFGEANARKLLEWNNQPAKVFARINTLKTPPDACCELWQKERVDSTLCAATWLKDILVFELKSHPPLSSLGSFRQGFFYLQDPSTVLAVNLLDPQSGDRILDYCAAPGGKAALIAQRVNNQALIVAHEVSAARLKLMDENLKRLGTTCITGTGPDINPELVALRFDRVLVDAPCSNTGVMRRRIDLRRRLRPEEIPQMAVDQLKILNTAAAKLRPGGRIVYSTCSLEPEENGEVVKAFLKDHPDFWLALEKQLTPFTDGVDGAYAAIMERS